MAQATATAKADYNDHAAAEAVVMAALGQGDGDAGQAEGASDTDATETAAGEVEDSDESADTTEESAVEGTESDDEEAESVEAASKTDDSSPFTAADKAAIAADPKLAKMAKGMQQSYTKKMQELGEVRKIAEMLKADPESAIKLLAAQHGLKARLNGEEPAPAATPVPAAAATGVQAVIDAQRAEWLPIIGEAATDAMVKGMQRIAEAVAGSKVDPLVQSTQAREQAQVQQQVNADMERFTKEVPDWKSHEAAMVALAAKINPQGMSTYETVKFLYDNVTKGQQVAKATTEAVAKVSTKVKRAVAAAEPAPHTHAPGKSVKVAPTVYKTPQDAVRASLIEMGFTDLQ